MELNEKRKYLKSNRSVCGILTCFDLVFTQTSCSFGRTNKLTVINKPEEPVCVGFFHIKKDLIQHAVVIFCCGLFKLDFHFFSLHFYGLDFVSAKKKILAEANGTFCVVLFLLEHEAKEDSKN